MSIYNLRKYIYREIKIYIYYFHCKVIILQ